MPSEQQDIDDLKTQVARLTRLVEGLYQRMGEVVPTADLTIDAPPPDVLEAVQSGQLITAIKLWRERTGLGLAEAKIEIDELQRRLGL